MSVTVSATNVTSHSPPDVANPPLTPLWEMFQTPIFLVSAFDQKQLSFHGSWMIVYTLPGVVLSSEGVKFAHAACVV